MRVRLNTRDAGRNGRIAAPVLDPRPRAGAQQNGVLRQEFRHDFEVAGIANLNKRRAGEGDRFTLLQEAKDAALRRAAHFNT